MCEYRCNEDGGFGGMCVVRFCEVVSTGMYTRGIVVGVTGELVTYA